MVSFEVLTDAAVTAVARYGLLAFFIFVVLETSFILHFIPSEIVVPVAAASLVTDPFSFALFVGVATTGSLIGSLIAYWFGWRGDRLLNRYADRLGLHEEIERSKDWFERYGQSLMLWGRLIPILRTPISIPAGFAGMNRARFVVYSVLGWFVYNLILTWLVYGGSDGQSPFDAILAALTTAFEASPVLTTVLATLLVAGSALAWYRRQRLWAALPV